MSDTQQSTVSSRNQSAGSAIEGAVARFEQAWHEGGTPRLDDYVPAEDAQRPEAVVQLAKIDLAHRLESGEAIRVEQYFKRFPQLAEDRSVALKLITYEYKWRRRSEPDLLVDEYFERFPDYRDELRDRFSAEFAIDTGEMPTVLQTQDGEQDTTFALQFDEESLPADFGRYKLLAVLGEGGFGTVYRAHDTQLDRDVAVKIPRPGALASETQVKRLYREARSGARLRHPNICPIYDVGEFRGHHYIVMGLIEGNSLRRYKKPMDARTAAVIVLKLADALAEAHDQGIIHRDLKPSNIVVENKRREPVILDFGLARKLVHDVNLTHDGQVFGTPAYMSPEQARAGGSEIGPSTDIYSLGVILYELVAGRPPFEGSIAEVFAHILTKEPEPPSKHRPGLDAVMDAICLKAIAKDPADRFESMREFAKTLKEYITGAENKSGGRPAPKEELVPEHAQVRSETDTAHQRGSSVETLPDTGKIEFSCPRCGLPVRTPASTAGKKGMCPSCGAVVPIPHQSTRKTAARARSSQQAPSTSTAIIEFHCPHCHRLVRTPPGTAGKKGMCPGCGRIVDIPIIKLR